MSNRMPAVDRTAATAASVRARHERALVKERLRSGDLNPVFALRAAPTSSYGRMRVSDFLEAIPGIGPVRAGRILEAQGIAPTKRIGGLGKRQHESLARFLARNAGVGRNLGNRLIVLAGPTAVGKGTVADYIRAHYPEVMLSISATTRKPRPSEVDGENYYFVDDAEFDRLIAQGKLLEWATVHNAFRYGTPREPVDCALAAGRKVMLEIDLQGARKVRQAMPDAFLVFLAPPSWDELVRRLVGRGTESPEEQKRRLGTARVELAAIPEFDAVVINDDVSRAAREVVDLMGIDHASSGRARP